VKIRDRKPVYPEDAQAARVQGVVILETRITSDGSVSDARIVRSVSMLDVAALEAVLAWKFTPPGFPLQMMVTVNFTLDGSAPAGGVSGGVSKGVGGGVAGGVAGGVGGGVAGGVAGGVTGGVAGGVTGDDPNVVRWTALPGGEKALRVGGGIKAPQKIVDVKPVYPKDALDAKVQGVVIIETAIGPDGKVKDAKILRSVPMLDEAALEAVRQWEFAPTLLNGVGQTVIMTVTVNFTLE
jgi:TonB family protein